MMNRISKTVFFLALLTNFAWDNPVNDEWKLKVDDALWQKSNNADAFDFLILLNDQADISEASALRGKSNKGTFVFNQLKIKAEQTQQEVIQVLESHQASYKSFFIVNAIAAKGDWDLIEAVASLEQVAQIQDNPKVKIQEPLKKAPDNNINQRNVIEWGVMQINAPAVWDLGYQGQGVIVGGQDTGYEWEHPAIKEKYNGWNGNVADHNYNWHDAIHELNPLHNDPDDNPANNPCGLDSNVPCDDHNHGTHTMGTMVGDDGQGNQIGVAPQASWIACRNMDRGYGSPSTYIECFEWFLAPTDLNNENPDPLKAPHVIANSWSCPELEGCNASNWAMMETVVNNLKAAGVVVVVSAGNSGSDCSTVQTPAAMFENSFTVGASNPEDGIAGFSSRGPVMVDASGRMKPNVVAPGVGVRSAVRGDEYQTWNGTSMAGPHVAGAVALLISANPDLAGEVEMIETIFEQTSLGLTTDQTCGGVAGSVIPNNTYGHGRIDVLAAVEEALNSGPTSVSSANRQKLVSAFPNPFTAVVNLSFNQISGEVQFILFDGTGKSLRTKEWSVDDKLNVDLDLSDLADGIYFYNVYGQGELLTSGKLLKL